MGSLPSLFIFSTTCIFSTTSIGFARHSQHHQMHIYRVPKTGSTTLITTMGKMKCAHLTLHDHSDGCKDLNWCNGSTLAGVLPTQPVVAGLRHVCDRLKSQWRHMRYVDPSPTSNISISQFVELLQNWTRGCPEGSAGVHCKVIKIKRHCSKNCPGVILWPQAFYMARRTVPICCTSCTVHARWALPIATSKHHTRPSPPSFATLRYALPTTTLVHHGTHTAPSRSRVWIQIIRCGL